MNREIKFRIFDPSINDFLNPKKFGFLADLSSPVYKNGFDKLNSSSNSEKCLISQFTGLHDKNGKEIYENDILAIIKLNLNTNNKCVRFISDTASFSIANITDFQFENNWDIWQKLTRKYILEFNFQVIGNIYENPELLDGSVVA